MCNHLKAGNFQSLTRDQGVSILFLPVVYRGGKRFRVAFQSHILAHISAL